VALKVCTQQCLSNGGQALIVIERILYFLMESVSAALLTAGRESNGRDMGRPKAALTCNRGMFIDLHRFGHSLIFESLFP
jgi:hypothetical protein